MKSVEELENQGVTTTEQRRQNILSTNLLQALVSETLSEDGCRKWILQTLHPHGIFCPRCKNKLTDDTTVKNFWQGKRCLCKYCSKRFFPTDGTILHRSHMTMTQIFALALLISLNLSNRQIAEAIGIHIDSVRIWRMKFLVESDMNKKE